MKKSYSMFLIFLLFPAMVVADENVLQKEINQLIQTVQAADCVFIRNNVKYSPNEAVEHILRKYAYFKDQIDTTEKFIELCASQSTLTRTPYKIECEEGRIIESRQWFLKELKRLRHQSN